MNSFGRVRSDSSRSDPIRSDPIPFDPIRSDPLRSDPIRSDRIQSDPIQCDLIRSDPIRCDPFRVQCGDQNGQAIERSTRFARLRPYVRARAHTYLIGGPLGSLRPFVAVAAAAAAAAASAARRATRPRKIDPRRAFSRLGRRQTAAPLPLARARALFWARVAAAAITTHARAHGPPHIHSCSRRRRRLQSVARLPVARRLLAQRVARHARPLLAARRSVCVRARLSEFKSESKSRFESQSQSQLQSRRRLPPPPPPPLPSTSHFRRARARAHQRTRSPARNSRVARPLRRRATSGRNR